MKEPLWDWRVCVCVCVWGSRIPSLGHLSGKIGRLPHALLPVNRHVHLIDTALRDGTRWHQQAHACGERDTHTHTHTPSVCQPMTPVCHTLQHTEQKPRQHHTHTHTHGCVPMMNSQTLIDFWCPSPERPFERPSLITNRRNASAENDSDFSPDWAGILIISTWNQNQLNSCSCSYCQWFISAFYFFINSPLIQVISVIITTYQQQNKTNKRKKNSRSLN